MKISCDIDGVVADAMGEWTRTANMLFATRFTNEDITEWDLGRALGLSERRVNMTWDLLDWGAILPIEGAFEVLADWPGDVVFITSRRDTPKIDSGGWLAQGFATPEVHHVRGGEKLARAVELGCQAHIEDRPTEIAIFQEAGFPVITVDQPWNRDFEAVHRCVGWGEISRKLDRWLSVGGPG